MPAPVTGRKRPLAVTAVSALGLIAGVHSALAATPAPGGVWMWDDGRAAVEFHPCGGALCGRIVWLKQEADPRARPVLDVKNPDAALRRRRVCGLDYISGVRQTPHGDWKAGRIYDFNGGASYDLDIDAVGPERITMRGYKGLRMLGATLTLVRAPAGLPLCALAGSLNSMGTPS